MLVPATDTDLPGIVALMNRAYRGADGARGWTAEQACIAGDRTTEGYLREDLAASPAATMLKWVEGADPTLRGCV